jgi:hypothetical protein
MSNDIVERLRSWRHDSWPADPSLEAAAEIERLRARVEVLETALRYYADDAYNGHNTNGSCARAALDAKP